MKKMYNKPQTEILSVSTEHLMDNLTLSSQGGNGPGVTDAPARQSVAPAVPGDGL